MNNLNSIWIDTREPAFIKEQTLIAAQAQGIDAHLQQMETGDFRWCGRNGLYIVERKAVNDLVSSLSSGRVDEQLGRLIAEANVPMLMIEGKIGEIVMVKRGRKMWKPSKQWTMYGIDHKLLKWQMKGLYIVHSPSKVRTPTRIVRLVQWTREEKHDTNRRVLLPPVQPADPRIRTLMTLPGVGSKIAKRLLKDGASLEEIFRDEWADFHHKLGPDTRKRVQEYIEG